MSVTAPPSYRDLYLFIAGERRNADGRSAIPVINPATGAEIGRLPVASDDDLRAALEAAAHGFERWRNLSPLDRSQILRGAAALLRQRSSEIARTMTLEQGKPLAESTGELIATAEIFEWTAEEGRRLYGRVVPSRTPNIRQFTLRQPIGVVAAFTPWNFPALTPARKLAGALGAGCSIILKPSEETPGTALALLEALLEAGLPEDVVSVVFGDPAHISETLIASPIVRKISFTGSIPVGKHLARLAADGMKAATLELGGHAPVIVSEHADVKRAASRSVAWKYRNAGQVCISPTRFLVHERVYEEFVAEFVRDTEKLRIGDGLDETTQMASLANERRRESIGQFVSDAVDCGARLETGGKALDRDGFFYAPTVLTDVPRNARILNDEPFGPVAAIARVPDLDFAITEANRLPYGLAAYAFTERLSESITLSNRIESGMVGINHFTVALAEMPFGGIKESGYGSEGGVEGLEAYTVTKTVTMM
jgi:succinate-semialdehyde dehydrogenase/glutarate-semialdehyde dehydrogenase